MDGSFLCDKWGWSFGWGLPNKGPPCYTEYT